MTEQEERRLSALEGFLQAHGQRYIQQKCDYRLIASFAIELQMWFAHLKNIGERFEPYTLYVGLCYNAIQIAADPHGLQWVQRVSL